MKIIREAAIVAVIGLTLLAWAAPAQVNQYTQFDYPGASVTNALGINDSGDIVGNFKMNGVEHGFLLSKGTFTQIDYPGAKTTAAMAIASNGSITGYYTFDGSTQHGFVLEGGVFTAVDVPGAAFTGPFGINPRGDVVGHTQEAGSGKKMMNWILRKGEYRVFDHPVPNTMTCAFGINAEGAITGHVREAATKRIRGWILRGGEYTAFDVPGSLATMTNTGAINAAGDVVGPYWAADGTTRGFLRTKHGQFVSIVIPGSKSNTARGINDRGQIVGSFTDAANATHAFIAQVE